jgi:mRNA interferase RelE/StbE
LSYNLLIERRAQKQLAGISQPHRDRIIKAVLQLGEEPGPAGSCKLAGRDAWRVRVGAYRIIYEIHDKALVIVVIAIGHRTGVYTA